MAASTIKIGIYGYGNLGRGVEAAITQNPDLSLVAVFTRRDPATVRLQTPDVPVVAADRVAEYQKKINVMILCGGSATDLPVQTPELAKMFNVVDSFDTHANIPAHFAAVEKAALAGGHLALISAGWDPGLFSMMRVLSDAVLPAGKTYTFWGRGVSQGHSDAIRRIEGVLDARQYTVPVPAALDAVRRGEQPDLSTREKHTRECFVVAKEGADLARIEREIKTMPNYFADYDTTVHFISAEELKRDHSGIPHGGVVLHSGKTAGQCDNTHLMEFHIALDSNPAFTSSVLVACARAVWRLRKEYKTGCLTVLDLPLSYLSPKSGEELRRELL